VTYYLIFLSALQFFLYLLSVAFLIELLHSLGEPLAVLCFWLHFSHDLSVYGQKDGRDVAGLAVAMATQLNPSTEGFQKNSR